MKSAEKNNTGKALEGKGDLSERAKIIRLATDYKDCTIKEWSELKYIYRCRECCRYRQRLSRSN